MTVAMKPRTIDYLEDGVSTTFPVPWKFRRSADVMAERYTAEGERTILEHGRDYTVSGGTTDEGGALTLTNPVAGAKIAIWSRTDRGQTADYDTTDTFPAETHENQLDRLAMVDQEQDADLARTPKVPRGLTGPEIAWGHIEDGQVLARLDGKVGGVDNDPAAAADSAAAARAAEIGAQAADTSAQAAKALAEGRAAAAEQFAAEAEAARNEAQAALIAANFYPDARTHVPQGLGTVAVTAGGSGGTDGLYTVPLTGGNLDVPAYVTVTVAGGGIVAASVAARGYYIGDALNVGLVNLSSITGLTGASVSAAGGYIVPSGGYYLTNHETDADQVSLFQNQTNQAVEVDPSVDWLKIAEARRYAQETRTKFRQQNYAGLASYHENFADIDDFTLATANGDSGSVAWQLEDDGVSVASSSNSRYRTIGPVTQTSDGRFSRIQLTATLDSLASSNGRIGLIFGDPDLGEAGRKLVYARGDGALAALNVDGSNSTALISGDASRAYVATETIELEVVRDEAGNGTFYYTAPSGAVFGPYTLGQLPAGGVYPTSFTAGKVTFHELSSDLTTTAQQRRIELAEDNSLPLPSGTALADMLAVLTSSMTEQALPSWYDHALSPLAKVYRTAADEYGAAFDPSYHRPFRDEAATQTIYVDETAGDDGNDGTATQPLQSLYAAVNGRAVRNLRILAKPGSYVGARGFNGAVVVASNVIIEPWGEGRVVSSRKVSPEWTDLGGGVHRAALPSVGAVTDALRLTPDGFADWLYPRTSEAEVAATAGTYWYDEANELLYVRRQDDSAPDGNLVVYDNEANFVAQLVVGGLSIWMKDIDFLGGDRPVSVDMLISNQFATLIATDCRALYGSGTLNRYGNGWNLVGGISCLMTRCGAYLNLADGFNYHCYANGLINMIEQGCVANDNGKQGANHTSGPNNGSTLHEAAFGIRVNGTYLRNIRNVHDISEEAYITLHGFGTISLNYDCTVGGSRGTGAIRSYGGFFAGTADDSGDVTRMVLVDCTSDSVGSDLGTAQNSIIYTSDFLPSPPVIAEGSNVTSYTL